MGCKKDESSYRCKECGAVAKKKKKNDLCDPKKIKKAS
jgi:hypothetical protein